MSDRLTDEQVAYIERRCNNEHFTLPWQEAVALAREVQEYRALRPTCPTCLGKGRQVEYVGGPLAECPACTDGKMPLAEWVPLLRASLMDVYILIPPERVRLLRPFAAKAVVAVLDMEPTS